MSESASKQNFASFLIKGSPYYLIGLILIAGGGGFLHRYWDGEEQLTRSLSGKIDFFSVGRGEAISIVGVDGKRLASCHALDCGYNYYKEDKGKEAVFILKNNKVVEIIIDGTKKIKEEEIQVRRGGSKAFGFMLISAGFLLLFIGFFNAKKNHG